MAHRLPPRHKSGPLKGKFRKRARARKGGRKRKRNIGRTVQARTRNQPRVRRRAAAPRAAPKRRAVARKRAAPRRNRYVRSNPRRRGPPIMRIFTDGVVEAGQMLVGKAMARSLPALMPMGAVPKVGYMSIAMQAGTAVVIGWVADMFLSKNAARAMTAGALSAPLETVICLTGVPWLCEALSPAAQQRDVIAAANGGVGATATVGRYVRRKRTSPGGSSGALGRYASERGMMYA